MIQIEFNTVNCISLFFYILYYIIIFKKINIVLYVLMNL